MQIKRLPIERMTLEEFADKHGLVMEIGERTRTDMHPSIPFEKNRFYASFEDIEVKDGPCLVCVHGNGSTEEAAMHDYAKKISGKCLVHHAFDKERQREIYAPEIVLSPETVDRRSATCMSRMKVNGVNASCDCLVSLETGESNDR